LLGTVGKVLRPTGSAAAPSESLPDWLNQHQPMFGGHEDAPSRTVRLAINYPDAVSGWIQRISHRGNPP